MSVRLNACKGVGGEILTPLNHITNNQGGMSRG